MREFSIISVAQHQKARPTYQKISVTSKTPAGAAKKAFQKVCKKKENERGCSGVISIREKDTDKEFKYKISRKRVNKKVEHDGKEIIHKFQIVTHALK
jgi:hypothetical protein